MLTSIALIFLVSLFLSDVFNRLKLPGFLGVILTGIILGPYALNLIDESILNISFDLRELCLVIILIRGGLSLNIEELKKVGRAATLMTFLPATFEIVIVIFLTVKLLHLSVIDGAILGAVLASSSPAVIVPQMLTIKEKGYGTKKGIPQMLMAASAVDDIYVIILFTSFIFMATGNEVSAMSFFNVPISIVLGMLLGIFTGILLVKVYKRFHMHIRDSVKVIIILSISFLFIMIENFISDYIAISGLLAVMSMSAAILKKDNVIAEHLSEKFSKLWICAEILLFVLVGSTVDISKLTSTTGALGVALILIAIPFRMVGVYTCLLKTNLNFKERLFCMLAYIPKATVQAAIGGVALSIGLYSGETILIIALISILITAPLGAILISATYKKFLEK